MNETGRSDFLELGRLLLRSGKSHQGVFFRKHWRFNVMGPGVDGGVETSSRPRMLLDGITLALVIIKEVCLGLTRQRIGQNEFYSGYQP